MTEANQPLSRSTEEFLKEVTRSLRNKPSVLEGAIQRITEKQTELKEINSLPEPERSFRLIGYNQTNFTFAYGIPNLRKMRSAGMLAVLKNPLTENGYDLGYHVESFQIRDTLRVPTYKGTFYHAKVDGLEISQSSEIFEALPENVVVKLFAAILSEEERRFLIENTGRK